MRESPTLRDIKKFKLVSVAFLASAVFVLGGWIWAGISLRGTGQPVILHFTSREGITKIGSVWDLTGIGSFAFLVVIMNFFLALALEERDWFLGKLTAVFTLVFSILIFIGFAAIIGVN